MVKSEGTTLAEIAIGVSLSPSILNATVPVVVRLDNSTRIFARALMPKCWSLSFKSAATSLAASPDFRSTDALTPLLNVTLIVWSDAELTGIPPNLPTADAPVPFAPIVKLCIPEARSISNDMPL